jgi:BolA protein
MEEKKRTVAQEIEDKLKQSFSPDRLEVIDESHFHVGHAGYREGGESHFKVIIKAKALDEYSRVDKHKMIYNAIAPLMAKKIHALSIDCK